MKNIFSYITMFILLCVFMFGALRACEHEAQQNEIKNRQWAQDIADNRHFTNFGE